MIRRRCAVLFVFAISHAGLAQTPPLRALRLAADSVKESYVPIVRVSGATRVGLVSGDTAALIMPGQLTVVLGPTLARGNLCVRIISVDGQYQARFTVPHDSLPATGGLLPIRFDSRYFDELAGLKASALAIDAVIAPSCEVGPGLAVVASWGDRPDQGDFWILVNSGQHRTSVVATLGDSVTVFPCESVEGSRRVAFDVRCRITLPRGRPAPSLVIRRQRLGNRLLDVPVPIAWR